MSGGDSRKRNLDRRRETSRYAARDRRGKEADIFIDLKDIVPVVNEATVTHVDRIALLRVAATLCKLRKCVGGALSNQSKTEQRNLEDGQYWTESVISQCMDGFLMVLDSTGCVLYVSESVSVYLGLTQTDMSGRFLKDFIHADDNAEFVNHCQSEKDNSNETIDGRIVVWRMKSVISPRGRNLNLKSAILKPITFRLRTLTTTATGGSQIHLLQAITTPAGQGNATALVNTTGKNGDTLVSTFMTRHSCDMKFSYISESMGSILKVDNKALMGTSYYDLVHPADVRELGDSIRTLIAKGHCRTPYYRLVSADGGAVWVQTEGTTINHTTRGQRGQYVICVHHLIGVENQTVPTAPKAAKSSVHCSSTATRRVVKAETDDTQVSARKSSYDDLLQWLFRDHPNSPAPSIFNEFPEGNHVGFYATSDSTDSNGPVDMASTRTRSIDHPKSAGGDRCLSSQYPSTGRTSFGFNPLATDFSSFHIHHSTAIGARTGSIGSNTAADQQLPRIVSTVSSNDHFALSGPPNKRRRNITGGDLYPVLPAAHSAHTRTGEFQHPGTVTIDPCYAATDVSQLEHLNMNSDDDGRTMNQAANSDWLLQDAPNLESLAPFLPQEEMLQLANNLPVDIQGLFPEISTADWSAFTPSQPLNAQCNLTTKFGIANLHQNGSSHDKRSARQIDPGQSTIWNQGQHYHHNH